MIKINKPARPPEVLRTYGKAAQRRLRAKYESISVSYILGAEKFSFRYDVYAHDDVKQALLTAQSEKCCFCEVRIGADGDVEHFRPKGGVAQAAGEAMLFPGYYWLAYDWDNLFLACGPCNSRHKRNLFPLVDPAARARSHHDDLSGEEPLFIDPTVRDPHKLIGFNREVPFPTNGNEFGRRTIDGLSLDRRALNTRRREFLEKMKMLYKWYLSRKGPAEAATDDLFIETAKMLADAVTDSAEYASMMRYAAENNYYLKD